MTSELIQRPWQTSSSTDGAAPPELAVLQAHQSEQNHLLRGLPPEEYALILPHLRPRRLAVRDELVTPDAPIRQVYFIRGGVASVIARAHEGGAIEIGTIGNEGMVGMPIVHGVDRMPFEVFVQVEGEAWQLDAKVFARLLDERPAFRARMMRYAEYLTVLLGQSVACNRLHTIVERCARWLLMTDDRVSGDVFELTHEFLALMLGVRRAGVTVAMGILQKAGLVTYKRSHITVVDRPSLEEAACDCYGLTQQAMGRLLGASVP